MHQFAAFRTMATRETVTLRNREGQCPIDIRLYPLVLFNARFDIPFQSSRKKRWKLRIGATDPVAPV